MANIETKIQESWIKKAYQQEWATMGNNLVAAGTSMGITAVVTHLAQKYGNVQSDEALILTATITDLSTYYITLFGQFLYKDRANLKDDRGELSLRKVGRKLGEYGSFFGVLTAAYTGARMAVQYTLQKNEVDPVTASTITQIGLTGFFTGVMPMLRYGMKNLWNSEV
ncbi:MAG: hypothetical protein Q7K45_01375 [Nanoarchaeota archaeon]|nr:hypothetical protein [Nanoarchaeota archaeon]